MLLKLVAASLFVANLAQQQLSSIHCVIANADIKQQKFTLTVKNVKISCQKGTDQNKQVDKRISHQSMTVKN